jgi:hypothetical protein
MGSCPWFLYIGFLFLVYIKVVKTYVVLVEVLKKKEKGGQNRMKLSLAQKKWCILKFQPHWKLMCFFVGFFLISPSFGPNSRFWWCVFLTLQKTLFVATPLWGKCEDETHTPKSGNLVSSRTPKTLELDCRGQNTSPWGVLYTVGKVLKFKCRKWPHMSHSNICSTSYGQKKGWESIWQFDSRPLKVKNRPNPDVCRRSVTHHWKDLEESYKFASDLIPIRSLSWELWGPKVPGVQSMTVSRLLLGSPGSKSHSDVGAAEQYREYYMREGGGLPLSPGRGESSESMLHVACPNTKNDFECELTNLLIGFDVGPSN